MPVAFVVGAGGAVGRFLLPRLLESGHDVVALSRRARTSSTPRLRWVVGDLNAAMPPLPPLDAIFSLGPLDAFARWFATAELAGTPRVVALGSTSVETKRDSVDAAERALAMRLADAERTLAAAADARGSAWTVFRPTLIYGAGVDRSLTPLARAALRWRVFPRPIGARGLRQPVHADDLAAACVAALASARSAGRIYALGGGERLTFAAMLERVRRSLPRRALPVPLPVAAARALAHALRALGVDVAHAAALDRLGRDLVVDDAAARADFGWSPRAFTVDAQTWRAD
ncbi:MAG TPA: NAD-dependent epimerase/dehydratase family protein [Dokdonella sp.]